MEHFTPFFENLSLLNCGLAVIHKGKKPLYHFTNPQVIIAGVEGEMQDQRLDVPVPTLTLLLLSL